MPLQGSKTVTGCLLILIDMIEEAQKETSDSICLNIHDRIAIIHKRDALDEARFRILNGRVDESWMRHNQVA